MIQSLKKGKLVEIPFAQTFADGIAVKKAIGRNEVTLECLDHLVVVDDEKNGRLQF